MLRSLRYTHRTYALALLCGVLGTGCEKSTPPPPPASTPALPPTPVDPAAVNQAMLALFKPPLPTEFSAKGYAFSDDKIQLGRMLYFDKRLSKNHDVSCNSCHDLNTYGVDSKKVSSGHKKQLGSRNSPSVYNAAGHFVQFWDGRAKDVEEQAAGPMMNPVEMAMPAAARVEETLRSIPQYVELFKKSFPGDPEPTTLKNAANAIGAFERRLATPSRWDKFLAGDQTALTTDEKIGLNTFLARGCQACHLGTFVGGSMFQKAGLVKAWPSQLDQGRFALTKNAVDQLMFKVPSLRNVEKTGPYFHDGSVDKLEDAVRIMGRHQLGLELTDADVSHIVAFLRTLTGTIPAEYVKAPELPPSTAKTPKPDPA